MTNADFLRHDFPDPIALPRVETLGRAARMRAALAVLPPKQRAVLVLRYYEHLSDAEIAHTMGVSRGTVRSQAARGLDKLRANGIGELEGALT